ncbi:hypothetical protein LAJ19_03280 [Deinococcus taeanensis]|uniref:hypothetical protein n=1 Tax=Deinococcus taeanensis TaxID=2737050 RepID=UPI001CDCFC8D|nr:hypothetical protein [Deinococcus taeanensis]UBV43253.1 hypothetical protein LAJ19_03280 [Deinococcus taeanensis]
MTTLPTGRRVASNRLLPKQEEHIRALNRQGLTDGEIAFALAVSSKTVAKYRKALGLPVNAHNIQTALAGEQFVVEQCQTLGLDVTHMSALHQNHPFDVLVNGWRVEVKTVHDTSAPGIFKFFLSMTRKGRVASPTQVKNYELDCDFVALVCKPKSGEVPSVFILTPQEAGEYIRIDLCDVGMWDQYREAWHQLEAACPQVA